MNVEKHQWTDADIEASKSIGGGTKFCVVSDVVEHCQPAFGMTINWNEPKKFWKPFFVIDVWFWHIQIGWLF